MSYDPNSPDAMFSKILERLDQQDRLVASRHRENVTVLKEIREQTTKTNGRVTKLEMWRNGQRSWIAGAAFVASLIGAALVKLVLH